MRPGDRLVSLRTRKGRSFRGVSVQPLFDFCRGVWLVLRYFLAVPFFVVLFPFFMLSWPFSLLTEAGAKHRGLYGDGVRALFKGWDA